MKMMEEKISENKKMSYSKYLIGVILIMIGTYSQYVFGIRGLVFGTLVVYVIPAAVIFFLDGKRILATSYSNVKTALRYGFGYFGVFSAAGIGLALVLLLILFTFNPDILDLLNRPNPLLDTTPDIAWTMIWFSFLIVGPFEEFLFRGYVFGGLQQIFGNRHWINSAIASSIVFSVIHLYYFLIYGIASIIQFSQIIMFSIGMCGAYYKSNGNLIIPAFIHGAFDATSFLMIALPDNSLIGLQLKLLMILFGIFVGVFSIFGKKPPTVNQIPVQTIVTQ